MTPEPMDQTRYRALRGGLLLVFGTCLGGAVIVMRVPQASPMEWAVFLVAAVAVLGLLPFVNRARERGDLKTLDNTGRAVVVFATLLLMQRMAFSMYGPLIHDASAYMFRPVYSFLPFLYLAAIALMRARPALRACWLIWALAMALTVPALALNVWPDFSRPGITVLIVWLLLANPLFILMMRALPNYEDTIERRNAEIAEMRGRTELADKLTESEARFNLVVQGLDVGVWDRWVGPPERRWWSPRFFELLGYSPAELVPTDEALRGLLHPEDRDPVWKAGTEQLKKGDILDVDFRLRTRNRGYRWFNSRARAQRDANGRMLRLAGSLTDIHERRTAEDALHAAQVELTRLAYRDTLTNLYNRRYFDEHFQREWERARRSRQPLALILTDLDFFKAYNDHYGHPAGDACLVEFAKLLQRCGNRAADLVARLGGEEFGLVLPATSAVGAEEVAQRLRTLVLQAAMPHEDSPKKVVTFSAGIAAIETPDGPGPAELFEQADRALYVVKRRGRDGVLRYGRDTESTGQHTLFRDGAA